jgi:quinol monooxygenase YgiN
MIHHVVLWTLKDPAEAPRFKALLDRCAGLVPGMQAFEVAIRAEGLEANVDVALISAFADAAAFEAYQNHPEHQAVAAQLGPMRSERRVLDYERP